jgi:polysaccharide export outer membrane protein
VHQTAYYQITPQDKLEISVFGEPEFDRTVQVSEDGYINYPPLGNIPVEGFSTSDVKKKIEDLLKKDYFVDPKVSIEVAKYGKFSVQGEVNSGGTFALDGALSVVDALVLAGGPTNRADLSKIEIIRTYGEATEKEYIVDAQGGGVNFLLKPYDRVMVPSGGKFYISGAIRSPGEYHITTEVNNLRQAIMVYGGGETPTGNLDKIEVIRKENGRDRTYILDIDTQGDSFLLKEQDRIIVREYGSISILGEVEEPGRFPLTENLTVVDAIALAGGFTEDASKNGVKVIRKNKDQQETFRIPVASILVSGDTSKDMSLEEGDTVVVPEAWF